MHYNLILVAASSLFFSRTSAECLTNFEPNGNTIMKCNWYGTSPTCGSWPDDKIGNWQGKEQLTQWTRYDSIDTLWKYNKVTDSCYNDYGKACVTGWKRLWCYAPNPPKAAEEMGSGHEDHAEHEDHTLNGVQKPIFAKHEHADIKIGHGRVRVVEIDVELD